MSTFGGVNAGDYCAVNNGGCSSLATCSNTPGSVRCTCRDGYTGDGYNCTGKSWPSTLLSSEYISRNTFQPGD